MSNLKNKMLHSYQQNRLGHFYILRSLGSLQSNALTLLDWIQKFLIEIYFTETKKNIQIANLKDIADFFIISPTSETNRFIQDDFAEMLNAIQYKPFMLKKQVIVITDAHLIGQNISNKLLKTLEEPPPHCLFFFLNPSSQELLKTVRSRALNLRIPGSEKIEKHLWHQSTLAQWISTQSDSPALNLLKNYLTHPNESLQMLDQIKKEPKLEEEVLKLFYKYQVSKKEDFHGKQKFLELVQHYQQAKIFSNAPQERLFHFLC